MFLEEVPGKASGWNVAIAGHAARTAARYWWIGRRRSTGRGEGRSGLRFDYVE